MAAVQGVATVWVPVEDFERAVGFYRDVLGLQVTEEDDGWAEVDANGLMIGLNARESEGAGSGGGPVISFQPDGEIEEAKQALEANGVTFAAEISEHPWGRIATFKDSEGNDLQLYAPPKA
jgi:predicted enzyme related to lactoylglutathione lyase